MRAVLLDIGHTLYQDHNAGLRAARRVRELLSSLGYDYGLENLWGIFCESRENIRAFGGEDFEPWDLASLAMMLTRMGVRDPKLVLRVYDEFVEGVVEGLVLEDDALDVLEYLKGRGYMLAVVSNMGSYDIVLRVLKRDGILNYFSVVVASQMIGWKKPSRKIYEYTLSLLGVRTWEAVHVGDDPIADVLGAKRAGLKAVHKPRPDTPPSPIADAIITRLYELKDVLKLL